MNKNLFVLIVSIILLVVTASAASALSFVGDGTLNFGSTTQQRGRVVTTTITIQNTNPTTDNNINIVKNGIDTTKYSLNFTNVPTSLTPNSTATITASIIVPPDQPAQTMTLGSYNIVSGSQSINAPVTMTAQNNLRISDAVAYVGTSQDSYTIRPGHADTVDVKPGDDVRVEVDVKNIGQSTGSSSSYYYDGNYNYYTADFDSADITVDSNGDASISQDDSASGIDQGKTHTFTFDFKIPDDAQSDDVATFSVTATDVNGVTFTQEWNVDFNIQRDEHNIEITSIDLSPDSITCTGNIQSASKITATVNLKNSGSSDEGQVTLELKAHDFSGYFKRVIQIPLDVNRQTSRSFDIPVPSSTPTGEYLIEATTYYQDNVLSNTNAQSVSVTTCPPVTQNPIQNKTTITPPPVATPSTPQIPFVSTPYLGNEKTNMGSVLNTDTMYVIILGLVALLLIVAIIVLIVKFLF